MKFFLDCLWAAVVLGTMGAFFFLFFKMLATK